MGKSSKIKRLARAHYSEKEFTEIVCRQCGLCPTGTKPEFCYLEVYKKAQKLFFKRIFNKLIAQRKFKVDNFGHNSLLDCSDAQVSDLFVECFCKSDFCGMFSQHGHDCPHLIGCLCEFRRQKGTSNSTSVGTRPIVVVTKKKEKVRYIPERYATFFCREGFLPEVKRMISDNGDSFKEQDNPERSVGGIQTTDSQQA